MATSAALKLVSRENMGMKQYTKNFGAAKVVTIDQTTAAELDTAMKSINALTTNVYVDTYYTTNTSINEAKEG